MLTESVAQLHTLDRAAFKACDTRSQRCRRRTFCGSGSPRDLRVGDTFQDAAPGGMPAGHRPPARTPGDPSLMTVRYQPTPTRTLLSLSRTSRCSPSSAGPPRWHSRVAWSLGTPRHGQHRRSHEQAQARAPLCRYRCRVLLAETQRYRQKLGIEMTFLCIGAVTLSPASKEKASDAPADR